MDRTSKLDWSLPLPSTPPGRLPQCDRAFFLRQSQLVYLVALLPYASKGRETLRRLLVPNPDFESRRAAIMGGTAFLPCRLNPGNGQVVDPAFRGYVLVQGPKGPAPRPALERALARYRRKANH